MMRIIFQIVLSIIVGLSTIYAGVFNFYSPGSVLETFYSIEIASFGDDARLAVESQVRLLSGMWIVAGIFVLISVRNFEKNANVIRLVLIGLSLGSAGELLSVLSLGGNSDAAIMKALLSIVSYIAIEIWRMYLVRKMEMKIND